MPDNDKTKLQPIDNVSIFSELSSEHQQQIIAQMTDLTIQSGQILIKEGEEADTLFFLLQGRLIVFAGEKPIAEISPGEPIGEIAFLTGGTRTATVSASRSCKLMQLDQQAYRKLIVDIPELTHSIVKSLAQRVKTNNLATPELEPKAGNVVALLPAGGCTIPGDFIHQLVSINNKLGTLWKVIDATKLDSAEQLAKWIENNEEASCQLILVASGAPENSEIALAMAEHADKTFLVLDATQQNPSSISALEKAIYEKTLLNNADLVLLRKDNSVKITGTSKLLAERQIHLHHHIGLNSQPDLERLRRFIAGKATGLVLCGGGAFGSAHLGMIKALQEQGYIFDMVGGTSIGSAMSALYALGHNADEALSQMEETFVRRNAMGKYTIPFYSVMSHKNFDDALIEATDGIEIEDLPINYFAVATSLSRNKLHIIRKGPLWQAIRASCSIPGIMPPYINQDGEALIDGALMDNIPVKTIRALKPGLNIVMNFAPLKTWKINSDYKEMPRGWPLLKQLILKRKPKKYYPNIFTVMLRTMVTNTELRFSRIAQKDDIFLEPKQLRGMELLSWKKSREQFNLSYEQMRLALKDAKVESQQDRVEALRETARFMKLRKKTS